MSELSILDGVNPATRSYNRLEKEVEGQVATFLISKGGKNANLDLVRKYTILGRNNKAVEMDMSKITQHQRLLMEREQKENIPPSIHVVADFDGVAVQNFFQLTPGVKGFLPLARLAKESNEFTIWSSRIQPKDGFLSKAGILLFMGKEVSQRITSTLGKFCDGNAHYKHKGLKNNGEDLVEMTEGHDLTVFIGSGRNDRKIIREYLRNGGDPKKLIYFDTGHLLL